MKRKYLAIGFVVIIMIAVYWTFQESGGPLTFIPAILSIDEVEFDDSLSDLYGKDGWIVTFTQTPVGSDYAVMGYTTLQDGEKISEEQIGFTSTLDYQQCRWNIQQDQPMYVYYINEVYTQVVPKSLEPWNWGACLWVGEDDLATWCTTHPGSEWVYNSHKRTLDCIRVCYAFDKPAIVSDTLAGAAKSSTTVVVSSSDGTTSGTTIDDYDRVSDLKRGSTLVGRIKLVGNLWSGEVCDSKVNKEQLLAVRDLNTQTWTTTNYDFWDSYKNVEEDFVDDVTACQQITEELTCYQNLKSSFNDASSTVRAGWNFLVYDDNEAKKSTVKDSGQGYFYANINNLVAYPVYQLVLDADWIKFGQYIGEPEILSASSDCYQTGDNGIITVRVKNKGTGAGNFQVRAECESPFDATTVYTGLLNAGESTYVYLPIRGDTQQPELHGTCDIIAEDVTSGEETDPFEVDVCVKQVATCPSERRCAIDPDTGKHIVEICHLGEYEFLKECDWKCENGACIDKPSTCGNGVCDLGETQENCPEDCGFIPPPTGDMRLIFSIIGFLVGGLISLKFFRREESYANLPFYKQRWFFGFLMIGAIVALVFWLIYPTVATIVSTIFPTFQCAGYDIGCWMFDIVKLVIWGVIALIAIKLIL